jgi:hypothetical protein
LEEGAGICPCLSWSTIPYCNSGSYNKDYAQNDGIFAHNEGPLKSKSFIIFLIAGALFPNKKEQKDVFY